jgi:hypothetical protein
MDLVRFENRRSSNMACPEASSMDSHWFAVGGTNGEGQEGWKQAPRGIMEALAVISRNPQSKPVMLQCF